MFGSNAREDYVVLNYLHSQIMQPTGLAYGQRDQFLTRAAVSRPFRTAFGHELYPTPYDKAAALIESIINRVVFKDGNKRTALAAATLYLARQQRHVRFQPEEAHGFTLHVVLDHPSTKEIADWLRQHSLERRLA